MGNCNRKGFEEEEDTNIQDKLLADLQFLKLKYTKRDFFGEFLQVVVPLTYLKDINHFKNIYRIKKNIKCQKDIMYNIKVIENVNSGRLFNAKIIKRSEIVQLGMERYKAMLTNEIRAMTHFKHPHMENLVDIYYEKKVDDFKLYIITDYVSKFNLLDLINRQIDLKKRFEDKDIAAIMKTLIESIYKFKTEKFVHRNLSPENIFFSKDGNFNTLSIRNLYFSTFTETNPRIRGLTGPLCYLAPEILQDQYYDSKVDIWSLGIVFYMLLTLENPLCHLRHRDEILEMIKTEKCFRKIKELRKLDINPDALTLTFKMLIESQELRISSEMLLEDRFFKDFSQRVDKNAFIKYLEYDWRDMDRLRFKIENLPQLHNIVFYLIFHLRNYFMEVEEIFQVNELYQFFDKNHDGLLKKAEIEEVLLKENIIGKESISKYADLLEMVIENDFYHSTAGSIQKESYSYEFFLAANILIQMYSMRKTEYVKKNIQIVFNELDLDKSGTITLDEIQNMFHDTVNKDFIKKTMKMIVDEPSYDYNMIHDFDEMTLEDITNFFLYDCVKFTMDQERELGIEKKSEKKKNVLFGTKK